MVVVCRYKNSSDRSRNLRPERCEGLGAIKLTDEATTAVDTPEPGVGAHEEPMATEASGTLILNLDRKHASWGLCLGASVLDAAMQNVVSTHRSPSGPALALGCS